MREAAAANRPLDQEALAAESAAILMLVQGQNRYVLLQAEKLSCLRKYVDMVVSIVECCPMDSATKIQFALHMLQVILPKLDTFLCDASQEAVELTRLADTLLLALTNTRPATSHVPITCHAVPATRLPPHVVVTRFDSSTNTSDYKRHNARLVSRSLAR